MYTIIYNTFIQLSSYFRLDSFSFHLSHIQSTLFLLSSQCCRETPESVQTFLFDICVIQLYSCYHTLTILIYIFAWSNLANCSICSSANDFVLIGWLSLMEVLSVFSQLIEEVSPAALPTGADGILLIGNCPGTPW